MAMNHEQEREHILAKVGQQPSQDRKREGGEISQLDYIAVPQPRNLPSAPIGNCLVWRHSLNRGGYGTGSFGSYETLAHRQAFVQSRRRAVDGTRELRHFCNRPFCVQPSHLSEATSRENAKDRVERRADFFDRDIKYALEQPITEAARYRWSDPTEQQASLVVLPENHECEYIIPASDRKLCAICEQPEGGGMLSVPKPDLQPDNHDTQSAVVKRETVTFTDIEGGVLGASIQKEITLPMTRAARRRVKRDAKRRGAVIAGSEPILLSNEVVSGKEMLEGASLSFPDKEIYFDKPGIVAVVVTPVKKNYRRSSV